MNIPFLTPMPPPTQKGEKIPKTLVQAKSLGRKVLCIVTNNLKDVLLCLYFQ